MKALADTAAALAAVANALAGKGVFVPGSPSPLPHPSGAMLPTVKECINEMLSAKARANRADRYLRQLRVSLTSFCKGRANVPISQVSFGDVEKWVFRELEEIIIPEGAVQLEHPI